MAIILIDMKTRFGSGFLSYSIAILWPLAHVSFVVFGYALVNKIAPFGGDPFIFMGSAILPYCLAFYPAKMIGSAVYGGRALLSLPVIAPIHLLAARIVLESLAAIVVAALFVFILYLMGVEVVPNDVNVAISALGATIYFGICAGVFMSMMMATFGIFGAHAVIIILIIMYITSSVYIPLQFITSSMHEIGYYNPIFNLVGWLRMSYFIEYGESEINKQLIFIFGAFLALIGIAAERFMRGRFIGQ